MLVVTGTGTGVGKTVVTAAIAALARARGWSIVVVKPVQTGVAPGEAGDLAEVARLTGVGSTWSSLATRLRCRRPPPPGSLASRRSTLRTSCGGYGTSRPRTSSSSRAQAACWCDTTMRAARSPSVAYETKAPLVVVTEPGLGTLNSTALTLEAMAHRGLQLAGLVIGAWPAEPDLACRSNIRDLEMLAARPLDGALPAGAARLSPAAFAAMAAAALGPAFGGRFDAADFRRRHDPARRFRS